MLRNRWSWLTLVLVLASLMFTAGVASAANRPAGTVWSYGQSGYVYPASSAQVTATNVSNGRTYTTGANAQGQYVFAPMLSGTYRITARYYNPRTRRFETGTCSSRAVLNGQPPYIAYGFNINTR
jgi:phosphoglycerol transferase MdoB-like AlkP superfamily enzyme